MQNKVFAWKSGEVNQFVRTRELKKELAKTLLVGSCLESAILPIIMAYTAPNTFFVPNRACAGPVMLDPTSGLLRQRETSWVHMRSWDVAVDSTLYIRCGPAVHAIGVDSYKEMIGDKLICGLGSLIAGIVGISFKIQKGKETEGSEEKESHCNTKTARWSRRFGGSEAGFETWKTIDTAIFEPTTMKDPSTSCESNFRLKRLTAFTSSKRNGFIGCLALEWSEVTELAKTADSC
eukprot:jgi/Bigna1/137179/aug1.38_g11887